MDQNDLLPPLGTGFQPYPLSSSIGLTRRQEDRDEERQTTPLSKRARDSFMIANTSQGAASPLSAQLLSQSSPLSPLFEFQIPKEQTTSSTTSQQRRQLQQQQLLTENNTNLNSNWSFSSSSLLPSVVSKRILLLDPADNTNLELTTSSTAKPTLQNQSQSNNIALVIPQLGTALVSPKRLQLELARYDTLSSLEKRMAHNNMLLNQSRLIQSVNSYSAWNVFSEPLILLVLALTTILCIFIVKLASSAKRYPGSGPERLREVGIDESGVEPMYHSKRGNRRRLVIPTDADFSSSAKESSSPSSPSSPSTPSSNESSVELVSPADYLDPNDGYVYHFTDYDLGDPNKQYRLEFAQYESLFIIAEQIAATRPVGASTIEDGEVDRDHQSRTDGTRPDDMISNGSDDDDVDDENGELEVATNRNTKANSNKTTGENNNQTTTTGTRDSKKTQELIIAQLRVDSQKSLDYSQPMQSHIINVDTRTMANGLIEISKKEYESSILSMKKMTQNKVASDNELVKMHASIQTLIADPSSTTTTVKTIEDSVVPYMCPRKETLQNNQSQIWMLQKSSKCNMCASYKPLWQKAALKIHMLEKKRQLDHKRRVHEYLQSSSSSSQSSLDDDSEVTLRCHSSVTMAYLIAENYIPTSWVSDSKIVPHFPTFLYYSSVTRFYYRISVTHLSFDGFEKLLVDLYKLDATRIESKLDQTLASTELANKSVGSISVVESDNVNVELTTRKKKKGISIDTSRNGIKVFDGKEPIKVDLAPSASLTKQQSSTPQASIVENLNLSNILKAAGMRK